MAKQAARTFSTDLELRSFQGEEATYWVKDLKSFGLFVQVTPLGGKTFQYRYTINGKQERVRIGKYPSMTLTAARHARDAYETEYVKRGILKADLIQIKQKEADKRILFKDFAQKFAEDNIIGQIKNEKAMLAYITKDINPFIGDFYIQDVTPVNIREIVDRKLRQGYPSAANQIYSLLKRIFELAAEELELIVRSPVKKTLQADINKRTPRPSQRALKPEEIREFYTTLFRNNSARATKLGLLLSLLILVRKSELINSRWQDIDLDTGVWNIPQPKGFDNNKYSSEPFDVYMSSQVVAILKGLKGLAGDSEFILPGRTSDKPISRTVFNMAILAVLKKMPELGHFTVHDLRRTAASQLNNLGYDSDVIEKCLNHKMLGIRGVYNRAEYEAQRTKMMQDWSDYLFTLVPILSHFIELNNDKIYLIDKTD